MTQLFKNIDCIELYVTDLEDGIRYYHFKVDLVCDSTDADGNVIGLTSE